jgi:hypothetical protein
MKHALPLKVNQKSRKQENQKESPKKKAQINCANNRSFFIYFTYLYNILEDYFFVRAKIYRRYQPIFFLEVSKCSWHSVDVPFGGPDAMSAFLCL